MSIIAFWFLRDVWMLKVELEKIHSSVPFDLEAFKNGKTRIRATKIIPNGMKKGNNASVRKCPLSFKEDTSGHRLRGCLQQRLHHKITVRKCCIASLSLTSVAAVVKHFKAPISYSKNVGGKPQAARAILWFWHLLMKIKSTRASQQASQFCRATAETCQCEPQSSAAGL